ncbi:MAG: NADH-quinone oxidoreductase subunit N [Myxococcales bacterium]|nr:NADH-quinone oxidoreductase subunit N [Myxococcales bacterium]
MLHDLMLLAPLDIMIVMSIILLLACVVPVQGTRAFMGRVLALGCTLAFIATAFMWGEPDLQLKSHSFAVALTVGPATQFSWAIILLIGFAIALVSADHLPAQKMDHGEYYALLSFSIVGMMAMVAAREFFTLFIGLEIMSMAIYVLCGFKRSSVFSAEAAIKYFILGSLASGIMLLGIAFAYGTTGTTGIADLGLALRGGNLSDAAQLYATISLVLLLIGFAFKVAAVPFHSWTPDAYEGAPTPITGLMATGVKVAAVVAFLRVFITAFGEVQTALDWPRVVAYMACATIIFGNLAAIGQSNVKRMLAYSSIAHAGYILMAVAALGVHMKRPEATPQEATELTGAILYYLLVYGVANLIAFGALSLFGARNREDIDNFVLSGAARKHPVIALVLSISLLSLAGIPPLAGFFAKFSLFRAVLVHEPELLWLVLVSVLGSAVSAYYYLRPIVRMYMYAEYEPVRVIRSGAAHVALLLTTGLLLHSGLAPTRYQDMSNRAAADMSLADSSPVQEAKKKNDVPLKATALESVQDDHLSSR